MGRRAVLVDLKREYALPRRKPSVVTLVLYRSLSLLLYLLYYLLQATGNISQESAKLSVKYNFIILQFMRMYKKIYINNCKH